MEILIIIIGVLWMGVGAVWLATNIEEETAEGKTVHTEFAHIKNPNKKQWLLIIFIAGPLVWIFCIFFFVSEMIQKIISKLLDLLG